MTTVRAARECVTPVRLEARRRAGALANRALGTAFAVSVERFPHPMDLFEAFSNARGAVRLAFLQPDRGFGFVGEGLAAAWRVPGPDAIAAAADRFRSMPPSVVLGDEAPAPLPMTFAGFACAGGTRASHWASFGDGLMLVPRVLFLNRGNESWRIETELVDGNGEVIDACLPRPTNASDDAPDRAASRGEWTAAVLRALDAIGRGEAAKVVVARQARLTSHRRPDDTLPTLARRFPTCTTFAVDLEGPCFLGGTPERLAAVTSASFELMALAGTAPRGGDPAEDDAIAARLVADRKEREEHAFVVRALCDDVAPLAAELHVDDEPSVVRLPNLQHLQTQLRGRLRSGASLLDLAARLHPTPAVGGIPRLAAATIIAQVEAFDRGWYAAPLGWLDAAGDGELIVALRSALLVPGQPARLFAGCGIVARSDPEREFAESELKLDAIRTALRLESAP